MSLKWRVIFIFLVLVMRSLLYTQNDYLLLHDRLETEWFNSSIFDHIETKFFKYNRSTPNKALNLSMKLKVDIPNHFLFHIQCYKFASNEYRLFPINFTIDACKVLQEDTFGMVPLMRIHSNIASCPYKRGIDYYVSNYIIDESKYPPHVPRGMYKTVVSLYINKTVGAAKFNYYGKVQEIIRW